VGVPGPPTVTLLPGGRAFFLVHTDDDTPGGGAACSVVVAVAVSFGQIGQLREPLSLSGCAGMTTGEVRADS